ncbi:bifunctional riboflavin kinase/FAD synthetase [Parvibium lacunae]|uniref:Riboflavin biosynthesis protein n=1 Tax=Parvibium lacunae TaxID=1888893 RepID=A0A368L4H0_9BURK|nr:bifunctional riboflavin kinase/FAD synthetase [Parvibium lacunae]RCS58481.1 bifunctional riboflavin kinase/FAD synthetase [Parvibium lacunae]
MVAALRSPIRLHLSDRLTAPNTATPRVLSIGNFDGVHRGHQALLAAAQAQAQVLGVSHDVLTFEPHPREFFAQRGVGILSTSTQPAPYRIQTLRDRLEALQEAGADRVFLLRFNQALAAMSATAFVEQILVQQLNVKQIWIGDDFRFGARRQGDYSLLSHLGQHHGFTAHTLPTVTENGLRISSSAVRTALQIGNLSQAKSFLGHPIYYSGHVLHGQKLGRTLGFPTLNLRLSAAKVQGLHWQPALQGILVVRVLGLGEHPIYGVASLGCRPTVEEAGRYILEVHLFNWRGDAYGRCVKVECLHKLRDEEKYVDLPTLRQAITNDVTAAQAWLAQNAAQL